MHVCKHEMHIAYCTQLRNAAIPISNSVGTTVGMRAIFKYFLSRPSFSTVAAQTPLKKPVLRQSRPRKPHLLVSVSHKSLTSLFQFSYYTDSHYRLSQERIYYFLKAQGLLIIKRIKRNSYRL